jgi:hypothetical protein
MGSSIVARIVSLTNYCGPFQTFQSFNRFALFKTLNSEIQPGQNSRHFTRFAGALTRDMLADVVCSRMSCSRMLADALVDSAFYLDVNCRFALLYIALEEVDYGWKVGVMK